MELNAQLGLNEATLNMLSALAPALADLLDDERRAALDEQYRHAYHELVNYLYQSDDKDPVPTRAIVVRELPNLHQALALHLDAGDVAAAVDLADSIAYFLDALGRWQERDAMLALVNERKGAEDGGALTRAEFLLTSRRGEMLLGQGAPEEAEDVFLGLLGRMDDGMTYGEPNASYDRWLTWARLGRSLADQGRIEAAEAVYRHTLDALAELEQTDQVKQQTGYAYADLADVLRDRGEYSEAEKTYGLSLRQGIM